jgi:hypothetical protein
LIFNDLTAVINMAYMAGDSVIIEGHTDNVTMRPRGDVRDNWDLSTMRANSVRAELERLTIVPAEAFITQGRGETQPIGDNNTADGRQQNRRVVIIIKANPLSNPYDRFVQGNTENGSGFNGDDAVSGAFSEQDIDNYVESLFEGIITDALDPNIGNGNENGNENGYNDETDTDEHEEELEEELNEEQEDEDEPNTEDVDG